MPEMIDSKLRLEAINCVSERRAPLLNCSMASKKDSISAISSAGASSASVVSAWPRTTAYVARDVAPFGQRVEAFSITPSSPHSMRSRTTDLAPALDIGAIVFEIDRRECSVVLAYRMHRARLPQCAAIR
jgi:hypothetical protein